MAANQLSADQAPILYKPSSDFATKLITFECTWTIENINRVSKNEILGHPVMYSPIFIAPPDAITTEDKKPVEFWLKFYPKGDTVQNRDFVGVFLELKNRPGLSIMYSHSVVMANGEKRLVLSAMNKFGDGASMSWGHTRLIRRDQLLDTANGFLSNDSLTVHCEVNIIMSESAKHDLVELCDQLQSKYCPPEQLTKSMAHLLESGSYADVTFVLVNDDGQEIRAHKAILMTRSRVFADMFESRMAESVTNRVEIVESREVFKQALHFIYTGKVGTELDAIAKDLLICADKYQLDPLKLICEEYLYSNITTESNLSDLLALANRHNAHKLQTKVLDSMSKNVEAQLLDADKLARMNGFLSRLATDNED